VDTRRSAMGNVISTGHGGSMNDENIAHRHRHGKAWEQQREKRIDED
jgi:hypothetical protein